MAILLNLVKAKHFSLSELKIGIIGFLDSICITVFMSLCDIVGISDRLADHDSLSTQRYFQGKQLSRVVTGTLVLDHHHAIQTSQ